MHDKDNDIPSLLSWESINNEKYEKMSKNKIDPRCGEPHKLLLANRTI